MKKYFYILSLFSAISILALSCDPKNPPVDVDVPATAINIDKATLTLVQGDSAELVITLTPANSNSEITWKSSNEKVATIENGKIKTTARGTSTITATANGFSAKCNLTVTREDLPYQMVWSEEFDGPELDLNKWRIETGGGGWEIRKNSFIPIVPKICVSKTVCWLLREKKKLTRATIILRPVSTQKEKPHLNTDVLKPVSVCHREKEPGLHSGCGSQYRRSAMAVVWRN
jgi:hypothetical protein